MDRERMLACHLFFDFSWKRWLAYEKILSPCDPFTTPIFSSWPGLKVTKPKNIDEAIQYSKNCSFRRICALDENYPKALKAMPSPPPVLYIRGNETISNFEKLVAIVGTRKPTAFGIYNAQECARYFIEKGYGIVSGLARGIDTIVHREAIIKKSYTIAIMGCGYPRIYPAENRNLANEIVLTGGTLLTQFAPDTLPLPHYFPRRNALIAAMCAGTIVIEGSLKSGALITGQASLDLSLPTIVLTQDYRSENGKGAIQLLRNGAVPVINFREAQEAISLQLGSFLDEEEEKAKNPFRGREFSLEEFCEHFQYSVAQGLAVLEQLKLEDRVCECSTQMYYFRREENE